MSFMYNVLYWSTTETMFDIGNIQSAKFGRNTQLTSYVGVNDNKYGSGCTTRGIQKVELVSIINATDEQTVRAHLETRRRRKCYVILPYLDYIAKVLISDFQANQKDHDSVTLRLTLDTSSDSEGIYIHASDTVNYIENLSAVTLPKNSDDEFLEGGGVIYSQSRIGEPRGIRAYITSTGYNLPAGNYKLLIHGKDTNASGMSHNIWLQNDGSFYLTTTCIFGAELSLFEFDFTLHTYDYGDEIQIDIFLTDGTYTATNFIDFIALVRV